jgi:hypothetical protein
MKSFVAACVVAVVLAVGAAMILNGLDVSSTDVYTSATGARIS